MSFSNFDSNQSNKDFVFRFDSFPLLLVVFASRYSLFTFTMVKVNKEYLDAKTTNNRGKLSNLKTKSLLDWLESKFEKDMPYLTGLIKGHRKWLEKKLK